VCKRDGQGSPHERRPTGRGRRTTGLLISDTVMLDPLLDDAMRMRDGLGAWPYATDVARDAYEHEAADCIE